MKKLLEIDFCRPLHPKPVCWSGVCRGDFAPRPLSVCGQTALEAQRRERIRQTTRGRFDQTSARCFITHVKAEITTGWFPTQTSIDRVCDSSQMRTLGQIVAATTCPDKHVVCQMTCNAVRFLLGRGKNATQKRNVFVIPCVSVGNSRSIRNTSDLITIYTVQRVKRKASVRFVQ